MSAVLDARDESPEISLRRKARFVYLTDGPDATGVSHYLWRLDAGNNRPLGRARRASRSLEACSAAAAVLGASIGSRSDDVQLLRVGPQWTWQISVDGADAVSTHRYHRRVECLRGFVQFVAVASLANPHEGVLRNFGPNTLRRYTASTLAPEERS